MGTQFEAKVDEAVVAKLSHLYPIVREVLRACIDAIEEAAGCDRQHAQQFFKQYVQYVLDGL